MAENENKNKIRIANMPDDPRDQTTRISDVEQSAEDETKDMMVADMRAPKTNKDVEFSLEEDRSMVLGKREKRK
jgi:hypothetical protein